MKNLPIINIVEEAKKHPDNWLLFEVIETDEMKNPLRGRLIFCSKNRALVETKMIALSGEDKILYLTYSGEPLPKEMSAVL